MKPEISIIVPVYNVENYINGCIDSILNQEFKNFELILVNDGSTDKSGLICDEYEKKDDRVKVIHQEYKGVSAARNVGINNAKGHYIGFVDSDDYIYKDMYSTLYNLCEQTNSDIGVCKLFREIDGKIINLDDNLIIKEMDNEEAMKELFKGILYRFSLANKLFKKSCFNGVEFPEGRIHEDLSTTYKLFANSAKTVYTNSTGYVYVKRSNSILTKQFYEKRLDAFYGWDEILQFMKYYSNELDEYVNSAFGYGSIDNIFYILNQVNDKVSREKYLSKIRIYTKKYNRELMKNSNLSVKQKFIIKVLNFNPKFLGLIKYKEKLCQK